MTEQEKQRLTKHFKTLDALEACTREELDCRNCPYAYGDYSCVRKTMEGALELIDLLLGELHNEIT